MYLQADTVRHRKGHFLGKDDSRDSALPIYSTFNYLSIQYTAATTSRSSSESLITQEEFNNALTSNGYPVASTAQYQNLVSQAGPKGGITTKQQLAMFLSEIMWESDGLRATREYYCYPTFNSGCEYSIGVG